VGNKNNIPVNIRFVAKTSDIINFSENIRSDVKTLEVATLAGMSSAQRKTDGILRYSGIIGRKCLCYFTSHVWYKPQFKLK